MGSELCKTCIHTKVCMKDKNLVGDVFVMGHPMMFDNDKLYEEYKEREKQGFPCEDYMSTTETSFGWCTDCKEYDQEAHCCHRFSSVIRETLDEMQLVHCRDCKSYVKHDKQCKVWNHGVAEYEYCYRGEKE